MTCIQKMIKRQLIQDTLGKLVLTLQLLIFDRVTKTQSVLSKKKLKDFILNQNSSVELLKNETYFHFRVMRCLIRRYVMEEQRKTSNTSITEDDINEVSYNVPFVFHI